MSIQRLVGDEQGNMKDLEVHDCRAGDDYEMFKMPEMPENKPPDNSPVDKLPSA